MDDHTVLRTVCLRKQTAECIADRICEMRLGQKRIAERQAGGDAVLLRQSKDLAGVGAAEAGASPAPDAVRRGTVERTDLAPIVKPVAVRPVQRQEHPVQLVELEQSGQVVIGFFLFHGALTFPQEFFPIMP